MAVVRIGAVTTDTGSGGVTSTRTVAYTLDAAATAIVVRISWMGVPTPDITTGVTWDGTALTLAGTPPEHGDGHRTGIWVLASASLTTGAHNIVVTTVSGNWDDIAITITGYSGVDTASPTVGYASAFTGTSSPATVTTAVSAATGNLVLDSLVIDQAVADLAMGAGQTSDGNVNGAGVVVKNAASSEAGAGSVVTMSWTFTGVHTKAIAAVILVAGAEVSTVAWMPVTETVQGGRLAAIVSGMIPPESAS